MGLPPVSSDEKSILADSHIVACVPGAGAVVPGRLAVLRALAVCRLFFWNIPGAQAFGSRSLDRGQPGSLSVQAGDAGVVGP